MTTEQILQMNIKQLEKLTPQELRQSVSTLRSTSRKRYERVVESELYSPSVESLRKSATQEIFTPLRELADEQLINEFKRYRQFLKAPTSTVGGARKSNKKLREETKKATKNTSLNVDDLSVDEWLHYYYLVDEARKTEVGNALYYGHAKDTVMEVFNKYRNQRGETKEENKKLNRKILKEVEKRLQDIYDEENKPSAVYPSQLFKE